MGQTRRQLGSLRYILSAVAYDRLAESIRLICGGPVAGAERLTRRRRFLPVAVDVDDDIAVTVFLRRAHGGAEWETHVLTRGASGWSLLGGGGSGIEGLDVLMHCPPLEPDHVLQEHGSGGVADGPTWIQYAQLCASSTVDRVMVDRRREMRPPPHRRLAIVWRGRQRIQVAALNDGGQQLETFHVGGRN